MAEGVCRNNSSDLDIGGWDFRFIESKKNLIEVKMTNFCLADTFHINPQLQLHLGSHDTCVLSLSQHCVSEPQVDDCYSCGAPSDRITV